MSASRKAKHLMSFLSFVLVLAVILSTESRAALYGFVPISNNSGVSGAMALQLSVDVTDPGTTVDIGGVLHDQVLFTFYNDGPSSSIYDVSSPEKGAFTGVFLEDGKLMLLAEIHDVDYDATLYPEVDFGQPTSPSNPPGWDLLDPDFQATSEFSVDSEEPKPIMKAVSPGESLGLLYTLQSGRTFANVLTSLDLGMSDPDPGAGTSLRVALFVQNLGEDGEFSDMFVTPIPTSVVLGMLGLGVVGLKLRKFA